MDFKAPKHNTPSVTLLKNYQNKKSGKVVESRKEILRRFNGMDWYYQKQILVAFVQGIASDRNWACRKMFSHWDHSFIPIVTALWGQYHEKPLSWLILRYFPKDFLKLYKDELSDGRNYFYLCQRLVDDDDFVIDKERLYESDIIELYTMSKCNVSDDEIREVFFSMISKICRGEYRSSYMYQWHTEDCDLGEISILSNYNVSRTLLKIEYTLDRRILADNIRMWNSIVMRDFKASNEYRLIKQMKEQGYDTHDTHLAMLKKYYLKHLYRNDINDEEESFELFPSQINEKTMDVVMLHEILNDMQTENPAVNKLMNSFSLELVAPLPF